MNQYKNLDIVLIPFPFTDIKNQKLRPALLLSDSLIEMNHAIFAMITSSKKQNWKFNIELENLDFLSKEKCFIRLGKVFTLDLRLIKRKIGSLDALKDYKEKIKNNLAQIFYLN